MKVRLIAESMNKTDRNDAHIVLDLFKREYMPESYLPPREISESHARNISNMALDIFSMIHDENASRLRESIHSWVLQIDGTPDSEFSMIFVVRDSISGFTLWSILNHHK